MAWAPLGRASVSPSACMAWLGGTLGFLVLGLSHSVHTAGSFVFN